MPTKPIKTQHLTVVQEQVIDALLTGATDRDAAASAGVNRSTVNQWRLHHAAFQAELNRRRSMLRAASIDRLRALLPRALDAIDHALAADPPDTRVALRIVELTGITPEELASTGPITCEAVLDAEVENRRDPLDRLIGEPISELDRARVQLEWEAQMKRNGAHET